MKSNKESSDSSSNISRRSLLSSAVSIGALTAFGVNVAAYGKENDGKNSEGKDEQPKLKKGAVIVFKNESPLN